MDHQTKPYSAVTLVEPLLTDVDISRLTTVPLANDFLIRLMRAYFLYEWPVFTHFHKSLFLRDLRAGRQRFCSRLLVNVILAAACHVAPELPRRNEYWDPSNVEYLFLSEVRRLLELEGGVERLTTVQTLLVMNQTINEQAMDEISYTYLVRAVDMAKRMNLFGLADRTLGPERRVAREFTAWAVYSWQAYAFLLFFFPFFERSPLALTFDCQHCELREAGPATARRYAPDAHSRSSSGSRLVR